MINSLDEAIKRYVNNAEYERTHGNLQGCLEFKQLAEWLKGLKEYRVILDELKDEITRAHNDLIESENEYGENARYTENDRGYLGGLLHAYEMFGREYEKVNTDE